MSHVVGLQGLKKSGKSTVAKHLAEHEGYTKRALADPLKEAAKIAFGLEDWHVYTSEGKKTYIERFDMLVREILQKFGTEVGRQIHEDVWVKNLEHFAEQHSGPIVVDDVRFVNEAEAIRSMGGVVIGLRRPETDDTSDPHDSEQEMLEHWDEMADHTIVNDGSLDDLFAEVRDVLGISG